VKVRAFSAFPRRAIIGPIGSTGVELESCRARTPWTELNPSHLPGAAGQEQTLPNTPTVVAMSRQHVAGALDFRSQLTHGPGAVSVLIYGLYISRERVQSTVRGHLRTGLRRKFLAICAPAVPRRLWTTPEVGGFEYKFGRGPGI
jgi:hypothetical protein